jgi:hypothetical protein
MGIKYPNSNELIYLYSIKDDDKLYTHDGNELDLGTIEYANIIELYNQNYILEKDYEHRFRLITDNNRYPPILVKDKDGKYVIKFFRKSILKLKSQPHNKIIKTFINCSTDLQSIR